VARLDVAQGVPRTRIQACVGEPLERCAFHDEAVANDVEQAAEPAHEVRLVRRQVPEARQIERDDTDGTGERVRPEQPAAAVPELAHVEAQTAAHAARVVRRQLGGHQVRETREAEAPGRLPTWSGPRVVTDDRLRNEPLQVGIGK
jgi:hypothetical protein